MDRPRKIYQIKNRSGRVSKISNLEVNPTVINRDYQIEPCDGTLSETGKLEILRVLPKSGDCPYFTARWDQEPEHLDVDMHGASRSAIKKFKNNKDGYLGHHTSRSTDPDKRIFDVKIETPASVIFEGTISFANSYDVIITEKLTPTVTVDARVIRAGSEEES
jgi:hypothetical protein